VTLKPSGKRGSATFEVLRPSEKGFAQYDAILAVGVEKKVIEHKRRTSERLVHLMSGGLAIATIRSGCP